MPAHVLMLRDVEDGIQCDILNGFIYSLKLVELRFPRRTSRRGSEAILNKNQYIHIHLQSYW